MIWGRSTGELPPRARRIPPTWRRNQLMRELPPRARRIQAHVIRLRAMIGTTSACAENTKAVNRLIASGWNYLRVRGEYSTRHRWGFARVELPPRARRIHHHSITMRPFTGTTSACAENTAAWLQNRHKKWNYLRVRGEYRYGEISIHNIAELPPRARRIRVTWRPEHMATGTTSACAENTHLRGRWGFSGRNYLRVRGEYVF